VALFVWRDDLSVGNVFIDNDHRQLITLVNDLFEAMEQRKSKDILVKLLDDLIKFTEEHFKREEEIMHCIQYAELSTHKEEHERLFREILDLRKKFIDGKLMLSIHVSRYLSDWVFNHVMHDDKILAAAMRNAGFDTSH
jgi:hemerythrin